MLVVERRVGMLMVKFFVIISKMVELIQFFWQSLSVSLLKIL